MSGEAYRVGAIAIVVLGSTACGVAEPPAGDGDSEATEGEGSTAAVGDDLGDTTAAMPDSTGGEGEGGSDDAPADDSSGDPVEPGCGNGIVEDAELCDDANDNAFDGCLSDCTSIEPIDPPPLEWTYYEIEGTQCLDGSPAGFAISHAPESTNLMIYLEGGGACFNDGCDFTAFNIPFAPPSDGIFGRDNEANPVRDWSMVYVPYCTGDIHAGDGEAELGGSMRQFRGYSNITRYLQTLVPSLPQTEMVLLTGISAGGFGAALNATQTADAFGEDVQMVVVDDSGPPLSNGVIAPCLQESFRELWNLDETVLAACPACDPNDFATDLFDHVVTNYPDLRLGLYSNTGDQIIRTYMGFGWGNGQHDNCGGIATPVPVGTYNDDLMVIRGAQGDVASTFYRTGLSHTVLRVGYNITSVDGTSVPEWIASVIAGEVVHVGP